MPVVKLNISLDETIAKKLRIQANELRKPVSRYIADLVHADSQRAQDELADEGYRLELRRLTFGVLNVARRCPHMLACG